MILLDSQVCLLTFRLSSIKFVFFFFVSVKDLNFEFLFKDMELIKEMNDLGLPVSFRTNKEVTFCSILSKFTSFSYLLHSSDNSTTL